MRKRITFGLVVALIAIAFVSFVYFKASHPQPISELPSPPNKKTSAEKYYQNLLKNKSEASTQLQRLEQQVNAKYAFDTQDWYGARAGFMRVLAQNPKDFQAWVLLIKSLSELKNIDTNIDYESEYESARINAAEVASNRVDKDLINSFDSVEDPKQKQRLQALLARYPVEFLPYFLDIPQQADRASACISWTYPLLKKRYFHYENALTIVPDVKDLGVVARGNKLCFEGLRFGENYNITLKQGLPGESDVKLAQDQTLDLYVPHRKPTIRFRERGYILPTFGEQLVPFMAVNVSKVQIKIIHIPERNIQSIQNNWFANQISRWEIDGLSNENGELVWEGTYHCESEIDRTGVTGFPITKILGQNLQTGVYVIEAHLNGSSYDSNEFTSQALIVSDIGLSTYSGADGLTVMARSLDSAKIMPGVQITLLAKNNRELATNLSNAQGLVHFPAAVINGEGGNAPGFLTASLKNSQFTVLNLRNESFDLSDRGAQGRVTDGPIEAYLFPERGIYRPGETVHLLSLLRQANGNAQTNMPLTLMIYRPDGVLAQTSVLQDGGSGGYQLDYLINRAAPIGLWTAQVYSDPNSHSIGRTSFEVHDFVPPRIEVKAVAKLTTVVPNEPHFIDIKAQYYFGPPAVDLQIKAESILVKAEQPFAKWQEYQFGLEEESWAPLRISHKGTTTDSNGNATIDAVTSVTPQTSHLLQLVTNATVFEIGGRGQSAKQTSLYWSSSYAIGIKPHFKDKHTASNSKADFSIIAVNQQGQLENKSAISYTLYEEQQDYVWFRSGSQWQYEVVTRDRVVSNGKIDLTTTTPTSLALPVTSNLYRLEILDEKTGIASSLRFSAGWAFTAQVPDKPDVLDLKVENDKIYIKPPFAGEVFLAVAGENFTPILNGKIGMEGLTMDLPATLNQAESGQYIIATVFRPADVKTSQMPSRAVGVAWFQNEKSLLSHMIDLKIEAPKQIKSNQKVDVKIKVPSGHRNLQVTAALVDEAILSLTDFTSYSPLDYFFSQKKLGFELRDSYGLLINPFGARPGSFEEGADASDKMMSSRALSNLPARSYKVVSLYSGIIHVNDKTEVSIPFEIPEYSGKLRLMAIAWDEKGLGKADTSILVRDEVDVYFVLPRFLAPQDQVIVPLVLHNLEGKAGDYTVTLQGEDLQFNQTVSLKKGEQLRLPVNLKFNTLGVKLISLKLTGPDITLTRQWEISVRPKAQTIALQEFGTLEPLKSMSLNSTMLKNFDLTTSKLFVTVGSTPDFSSKQLSKELMEYPYLCLEQTTSRMLATVLSTPVDKSSLQTAYNQLSSLQKIDGSFALWSPANTQEPWLSLYAADVLQIIKSKGHYIPVALNDSLLRWINEIQRGNAASLIAYASYLNAKEGKGALGTLRYFVETHQHEISAKQDAAFIAAAFAYYHEADLAKIWFDKAISFTHSNAQQSDGFGSDVRNQAILVTLLAETTQNHPDLLSQANLLAAKANEARYLSTQEKAWLIRAASNLQDMQKAYQLSLNKKLIQTNVATQVVYDAKALSQNIVMNNIGEVGVFYGLTRSGEPENIAQLPQQGFDHLQRQIYQLNGEIADKQQLKSGEQYVVSIKGNRVNKDLRHVILVDLLPAGFEIEDANLLKDNLVATFPWLSSLTPASRFEGRDDRFVSAYEFDNQDNFAVAYLVRAVSKGTFTYPAVYVEAMYQPQNFHYGQAEIIKIQ